MSRQRKKFPSRQSPKAIVCEKEGRGEKSKENELPAYEEQKEQIVKCLRKMGGAA